ncbi:MAG: protein tyrosine phosphatase family protein, partial [Gammaproteobacteria bacterium]|nr:protein tyrosine phosphatase family protein [Gammaproteobacteria bacterium]
MNSRISLSVLMLILSLGNCFASLAAAQEHSEMAHDGPAMNFLRISPDLATGGHFTDEGVAALAEQGVSLVIDLRDRPPEGQEERLAAAGIRWVNVPVVWKAPQRDDFEAFSRHMSENEGENILVQCQANYRASAMTYLYRVTQAGVPEAEARRDLEAIWT